MTTPLLVLGLLLALADDPVRSDSPRKPSPFAPSLPLLTDEEEEKLDHIIDRLILADTGKLKGAEAKKAFADFNKLGPEAIPALLRGLNKAAAIESSCPAVIIYKKLRGMLGVTTDTELLDFARENIGAGVKASRHAGILNELRVLCSQRKSAVARLAIPAQRTTPGKATSTVTTRAKDPRTMTVKELAEAAGSERGPRLKLVIQELGQRNGDEAIAALGSAAGSYEGEIQQLAREQLAAVLGKLSTAALKGKLKDDRAEVRAATARLVGVKELRYGAELIDLLGDDDPRVREAARQALVRLNRGTDYGPATNASEQERADAVKKWRAWWAKQK